MENFVRLHLIIMKPMMKSIDNYFPETRNKIIRDYFTTLYCEKDIPALWIEALSKKLGVEWKAPSDDDSQTISDVD